MSLDRLARDLRSSVRHIGKIQAVGLPADFESTLAKVTKQLQKLRALLETQSQRSPGLLNCYHRACGLVEKIAAWSEGAGDDMVRWIDVSEHGLQLHTAPLDISTMFEKHLREGEQAWIFASATLSVNGDFRHFLFDMGMPDAQTAYWESPYDYASNALLYVPENIPDPNNSKHTRAVVDATLPLLRANPGKSFLLFTSLRALNEARGLIEAALAPSGITLLAQGEAPRSQLLARFRTMDRAVLLGSLSFWQGVEARALTLVVIDKLPFAPLDDPLLMGRIRQLEEVGRSAFNEIQLPHAAILLKQGAGRLIRDEDDRGVLIICDSRILSRPYGRRILESLPPMKRTRDPDDVLTFLSAIDRNRPSANLAGA